MRQSTRGRAAFGMTINGIGSLALLKPGCCQIGKDRRPAVAHSNVCAGPYDAQVWSSHFLARRIAELAKERAMFG